MTFSIINLYYATAYVAFYIAVQFAFFSYYNQNKKLYFSFIFMTLSAGIFQYYTGMYYEATSINMVITAFKMQVTVSILILLSMYIFISEYTHTPIRKSFLVALTLVTILGLYENTISPYGLRFESITSSFSFVLPWGEEIKHYYGNSSPFFNILRLVLISILIWGIGRAKVHFTTNRYESILLVIFFITFIFAMVIGVLIDVKHLEFVYIVGFTYFFLVISMTFSLGHRIFIQQKKLEEATEKLLHENNLRQQVEKDFMHSVQYDQLTGLPNRAVMIIRLNELIQHACLTSSKIAILFIDLDNFKDINNSLGHSIGDNVLMNVSKKIAGEIRETDYLARLGGDEFCILIPSLISYDEATSLSMKLIESFKEAIFIGEHELYVGCSIGISIYPNDGETPIELLRNADSAMYKAKVERNSCQLYTDDMTKKALERISLETSLRQALAKEEFIVYYQAQVNGHTGALIGLEALIRWQHPTLGLMPPSMFIPLAEETALIVSLDRLVMKTAMKQIKIWYKNGFNPGILAINLAVKQLQKKDFVSTIQNLCDEIQFKPQWLELEITESKIMKNPEESITVLKQISEMGIDIAVDDFGTGHSSLSYLKRLPIDKLKIDKSFIDGLPNDDEDASICKAIIALAKSLNLSIIAEGVETVDQRDFLIQSGCDNIQGYLYGKPIPADEFEKRFLSK